jgi:uncharacterized protein YdhG (YjbR/CyaY superfamily)
MADKNPERSAFWPAIEKKYAQPMQYWFDQMAEIAGQKYPEQIAYLRENHAFSQTHANALVMYSRGSTTTRRHNSLDEYLKESDATKKKTVKAIFKAIQIKYPKSELVIAWNQPMLKLGEEYIFGLNVLKNHILLAPWSKEVLEAFRPKLKEYKVNAKTIQVPVDWKVDVKLLQAIVAATVAEQKK